MFDRFSIDVWLQIGSDMEYSCFCYPSPVYQTRRGELKHPLSEYAIDTLLMLTRHPVCQTRRGRTLVIRIYYGHMLDASSTSSRLHHENFVRASMIDVWQFIFVRGSLHPQPMARSQTREEHDGPREDTIDTGFQGDVREVRVRCSGEVIATAPSSPISPYFSSLRAHPNIWLGKRLYRDPKDGKAGLLG